jgi:hypothetical protein
MNLFEEELNEMILLQNNKYILTNISDLNRDIDYNEYAKIFKFFNINNFNENQANEKQDSEENKQIKLRKREKIESYLRDSAERTEVLISFLTNLNKDKSVFSLKNLRDLKVNEIEKKENESINYLKKVDFFENSIKIFNNRITMMKENKDISQLIFRELLNFKKNGFLVEENYKFPDLIETISTRLIHKITLNIENLLGKANIQKKFSLNLLYDYANNKNKEEIHNNKKFELKYDFYEKFNKKNKLYFLLNIKFLGKSTLYNLSNILDYWIEAYFSTILDDTIKKYDILNYLKFMFKYIWYKIFKIEIQNIIKLLKTNFYENKQFSYYLNKNNSEYSINSSYLDILEVNLLVMKSKPNINLESFFKDEFELKNITNFRSNQNKNIIFQANPINNYNLNSQQPNNDYLSATSSFSNSFRNANLNQNNNFYQKNYFNQTQNSEFMNSNYNKINSFSTKKSNINYNNSNVNKNNNCNNALDNKLENDDQTKSSVSSDEENKIIDNETKSKFEVPDELIVNFVLNIFTELKSFKSIREFYYKFFLKNSENANLPNFTNEGLKFNEFFDATYFNFNLNKFNQILLQKFVVCRIDETLNRRFITVSKICNFNYLSGNYLYRFTILNNLLNSKLRNMEFCIIFQKNKINIDFSLTKKNTILVSEKESNHEMFNKKINFNILFEKLEKFLELNQKL